MDYTILIVCTCTVWITMTLMWLFGLVPGSLLVMSSILIVIGILARVEDMIGRHIIYHNGFVIDYEDGKWVVKIDNHHAFIAKEEIKDLIEYLSMTLEKSIVPTSEHNQTGSR